MTVQIDFDKNFASFCQGLDFQTYVRKAISDEIWLQSLISKLQISDTIDNKLQSKTPRIVKDELKRTLPSMVEKCIQEYILNKFPHTVSKEIGNQMPQYLNNNYQMQTILNDHKVYIQKQLEDQVSEILTRITKDPQYHEITNCHLATMSTKADNKLAEINLQTESQLAKNQDTFDKQLRTMKNTTNKEMGDLKNNLEKTEILKLRLDNLEKKIENQSSSLEYGFTIFGMVIVVLFGITVMNR